MQTRKVTLTAILIGALCSGTYVLGQQNAAPNNSEAFERELDRALNSLRSQKWSEVQTGAQSMADLTRKAAWSEARSQDFTKQALAQAYSNADTRASVRLQASQVAQNHRIIQLLEQINTKTN